MLDEGEKEIGTKKRVECNETPCCGDNNAIGFHLTEAVIICTRSGLSGSSHREHPLGIFVRVELVDLEVPIF